MDKALFYAMLYDSFGDGRAGGGEGGHCACAFHWLAMPHVIEKAKSREESDQRLAAEIIFGAVRGSRYITPGFSPILFFSFSNKLKLATEILCGSFFQGFGPSSARLGCGRKTW